MTRHAWLTAASAIVISLATWPAAAETLGVFTKAATNPIARVVRAGAEQVAKANGVTLTQYIPTSPGNIAQQTSLVDGAIRDKVDAIVFGPVDVKAMVPAAQKINAAGIPLVNISDRLAGGDVVAFVGTDDYAIALDTARTLLKAMGGKGNLVILNGPADVPTAVARLRGFKDALKDYPNVKVALEKDAMYARPAAANAIKAAILGNPPLQIDGVLAANDAMAFGAIESLKGAGKKAPVVGINASKEAVDLIKSGDMLASGDDNGLVEGCLGVEIALRKLHNQPVPKEVLAKTAVVDMSNYQAYETPAERRMCPTLESMAGK